MLILSARLFTNIPGTKRSQTLLQGDMMGDTINILDCTLRDGGYYNAWDFAPDLVEAYLQAMEALPADMIEVGFRSMPGTTSQFKGANAYCTDDYINELNIPAALNIGVMINGADLLRNPSGVKDGIDQLFVTAEKSPVKMVRVACHVNQVEDTLPAITRLHELGYTTTIQLMQIAGLQKEEIIHLSKICSQYPLDILYFADSLGSMETKDITYTVKALRSNWKGNLGFHAHNSMEGALTNCVQAIQDGVTWVDGTVCGMGRGPGNARTEYLALELETRNNRDVNIAPLIDLIDKYFQSLKERYNWGPNHYYYMAGKYGIHPTFIQAMIEDNRFDTEDIIAVIDYLKNNGGKHYNLTTMEAARFFYSGEANGTWEPSELVKDKTVLILGSGPNALKYKNALESYIKKYNPIVIALNKQSPIDQTMIHARAACHPIRLLADYAEHEKLPQPLITAASTLPEKIKALYKNKQILDYGLTIVENKFDFFSNYGIIPNQLVISYVLAIIASGKAKQILMAGFDGFEASDPRNNEMNELLKLYMEHPKSIPLLSITPTRYRIPQRSIFELNMSLNS